MEHLALINVAPEMKIDGTLTVWLGELLELRNMTQVELARLLTERLKRSIDKAAVNKMISGDRSISADEFIAIQIVTGTLVILTQAQSIHLTEV